MVQLQCGFGLVDGPCLGEAARGEVAVGGVATAVVVVDARQSSMITWASSRLSNCQLLMSSSCSRPLKYLILDAVLQWRAGLLNTVLTLMRHQSATT